MANIKKFDEFLNESVKQLSDVIFEYKEKYPDYSEFFDTFIDNYPTSKDFKSEQATDILNNDDEASKLYHLTDDEIIDQFWYPELEIGMIEDLGVSFEGEFEEIWVNFYNDLINNNW
jgi:hypothetical protein